MSAAQIAADLRAAADVIERDGWSRGGLAPTGGHCAIEAIHAATGFWGSRPSDAVAALKLVLPAPHSIIQFNDYIAKDADEVIAALRAAADRAEAEQ